jgi:hypothetical protein
LRNRVKTGTYTKKSHTISESNNTSRLEHLKRHNFVTKTATGWAETETAKAFRRERPKKEAAQRTVDESLAPARNKKFLLNFFCQNSLSFLAIDTESGRDLQLGLGIRPPMTRATLKREIQRLVDESEKAWLRSLKGKFVTITVDIGTVLHRSVVFVVHARGHAPCVFRIFTDNEIVALATADRSGASPAATTDAEDDREEAAFENAPAREDDANNNVYRKRAAELTIANLNVANAAVVRELVTHDIFPIATTNDNGGNMVGMADRGGTFAHKCSCHGLQLVVNLALGKTDVGGVPCLVDALAIALGWIKKLNDDQTATVHIDEPVPTRWKCDYNALARVVQLHKKAADKLVTQIGHTDLLSALPIATIKQAIECLEPFKTATLLCESDDASMFSVIDALNAIGYGVSPALCFEGARPPPALLAAMLTKIRDRILSPPLVIVAYFSPGIGARAVGSDLYALVGEAVSHWLTKTHVAQRLFAFISRDSRATPIDASQMNDMINHFCLVWQHQQQGDEVKTSDVQAELTSIEADERFAPLGRILSAIADTTGSEAKCERVFSELKVVTPKERSAMLPRTQSLVLRAKTYRAATAADTTKRGEREADRKLPAAERAHNLTGRRARNVLPTLIAIVRAAGEKLAAIKANTAAPGKKPTTVNAKCTGAGCKRLSRRAETVDDFKVTCVVCRQWKCNGCVDNDRLFFGSPLLHQYKCENCAKYPRENWWDIGSDSDEDNDNDDGDGYDEESIF